VIVVGFGNVFMLRDAHAAGADRACAGDTAGSGDGERGQHFYGVA
jgi:hypothetical protein